MPERSQYRSLLPIDVGFDLRDTGHTVRVYEGFGYWYLNRANKRAFAGSDSDAGSIGSLFAVAEVLAQNGYCVTPFVTKFGHDVVVVPDLTAPGKLVWNIGTGNERSNRWNQGETLQGALEKSGWKFDDIQPLSSDEYV